MDTTPSRKNSPDQPQPDSPKPPRRRFKRFHQERCGFGRVGYDSYADVLEACERKLAEWEQQGVLAPYRPIRPNDWLFTPSAEA